MGEQRNRARVAVRGARMGLAFATKYLCTKSFRPLLNLFREAALSKGVSKERLATRSRATRVELFDGYLMAAPPQALSEPTLVAQVSIYQAVTDTWIACWLLDGYLMDRRAAV
jgi:hypothetical protein